MLSVYLFFKQQTAYEVRISDWSSDVCSADLRPSGRAGTALARTGAATRRSRRGGVRAGGDRDRGARGIAVGTVRTGAGCRPRAGCGGVGADRRVPVRARPRDTAVDHRSEEHTSELQSLMRISYAVFCLKKKN